METSRPKNTHTQNDNERHTKRCPFYSFQVARCELRGLTQLKVGNVQWGRLINRYPSMQRSETIGSSTPALVSRHVKSRLRGGADPEISPSSLLQFAKQKYCLKLNNAEKQTALSRQPQMHCFKVMILGEHSRRIFSGQKCIELPKGVTRSPVLGYAQLLHNNTPLPH